MFSFPEASRFLETPLEFPNPTCYVSGASIDTRTIELGNLFFALQGEDRDGHDYLEDAFLKGASGAVIAKSFFESEKQRLQKSSKLLQNLLVVEDTQKSFLDLARWHRLRMNPTCVGITGSVGKTSTKEFLRYVLRSKYPVHATPGNFNNHLGLPLTLLSLQSTDRYCVAELGASHVGEIGTLADVLQPSRGILTTVSPAHVKGFGSLERIYEAKLELLAALKPRSFAILPDHDPVLLEKANRYPIKKITVGPSIDADRRLSNVEIRRGRVHFTLDDKYSFSFPGVASFMAQNAAMAIVMAEILGVPISEMASDWDDIALPSGRFSSREIQGIQVIDDSYNSSPYSFEKALESFSKIESKGKKVIVFSDMLELGDEEQDWHRQLGEKISKLSIDYVAAYGDLSKYALEAIRSQNSQIETEYFESAEDLAGVLKEKLRAGDTLLCKASRGMQIERVIQELGKDSSVIKEV